MPHTAIMPMKAWDSSKSRLHDDPLIRRLLAQSFAQDTLHAVETCSLVARVVVVTADETVADYARSAGATVLAERAFSSEDPLNSAINIGLIWVQQNFQSEPVAVIPADLPALTSTDLSLALSDVLQHTFSYCPDRSATGTTMTAASDPRLLLPRYGSDSAALHLHAGAVQLSSMPAGLRLDVDTMDDLAQAHELGVGANTASAVRRFGLEPILETHNLAGVR